MSFPELAGLFTWCSPTLPTGFVLITDVLEADGSFLLQHFITAYTKSGNHTTLVGLENGFSHYFGIGRKLGINLMTAYTSGKLAFVNGLASPYDWTDEVSMEGANATLQAINQSHPFSLDTRPSSTGEPTNPLKKLYSIVEKIVLSQSEEKPVCVIIDNLNYLANSVEESQLLNFLQYCNTLVTSRKSGGCFVGLIHADAEEDSTLVKSLKYKVDLVMQINGFPSGYLEDLDGELTFRTNIRRRVPVTRKNYRDPPVLHYRVADNGVKFHQVHKPTLKN
eukprot:TRINITY_DN1877_c0_g1_i1.p1 TRINITY_DN1877_c0_g1~~TRINITY_DN1877_c0_g1_i1.p1  ORF type:complete len:279 (+),score=51.29 TRINITY_DN1877_c0_g1_i1:518-1354(+)